MAGEGTKKRWRIGGIRNKTKSKAKAEAEAVQEIEPIKLVDDPKSSLDNTVSTNQELSDQSSNSVSEVSFANDSYNSNNKNRQDQTNDLPSKMSDIEDSDNEEDVYLENDGDQKQVGDGTTTPLKAPQPMSDSPFKQVAPNIAYDDGDSCNDEFESLYEADMEQFRSERLNSSHFSEELAKISEEPQSSFEDDAVSNDNDYEMNPQRKLFEHAAPAEPTSDLYINNTRKEEEEVKLPSHKQLSKELAKLVATEHYSVRESLVALERISKWARTQDSNLLKHLLTYGGVVKVIGFLDERLEDDSCRGRILMECIHKAADVICNVCFVGKHGINEDIAVVNGTVVVKYLGIQSLVQASDMYNKCDDRSDPMALKAVESVWNAIMNVYCNAEAAISKSISMLVVDASIDTMHSVGSVDHPIAAEALANVFNTLYRITYLDFVTKEEFKHKQLLKHCLSVFQRDVTSSEGDEELLEEAFSFLYGCHEKELLEDGTDYEQVLPLCVIGLQEFAHENDSIREWATKLLDGACSRVANKESIMMAEGAIEALAPLLTAKDVGADEKEELRGLMRKILAPV